MQIRSERSKLFAHMLVFCAFYAGLIGAAEARHDSPPKKIQSITIRTVPVVFDRRKPEQTRFGKLIWRGGVRLFSSSAYFGGLSGLTFLNRPAGKQGRNFYAVSDQGTWVNGKLSYRNGQIIAVKNVKIGPILGMRNRYLRKKRDVDAEAIDMMPDRGRSEALISFERLHRIGVFPINSRGELKGPRRYLKLPRGVFRSTRNKGLEAVAFISAGRYRGQVIAIPERQKNRKGHSRAWVIGGKRAVKFYITRPRNFDITDVAILPGGDIVILERFYKFSQGVKMRLRRFRQDRIRKGAVLSGQILLEADQRYNIDNMEGLAVHQTKTGKTILTLISDDNFNRFFQQTLLLQFELPLASRAAQR